MFYVEVLLGEEYDKSLIEKDNKIHYSGVPNVFVKWKFPWWKVEADENEFDAIEREIKKVFELTIKV